MKTALITGITGQDGSYLAELLLEKGYDDFLESSFQIEEALEGFNSLEYLGKLLTEDEMNQIGMPAWDLVEHNGKLDHYRCHNWHAFNTGDRSPYASMYTSFGCPYKCHFCCINAPFGDMMKALHPIC